MNARSRLPLNALRVLEAVGRHGSLAVAAAELHVEPSAVSMQMKTLADYVGAPLLRRVGRGVELTAVARQLLPAVASGLQQIDDALRIARHRAHREFQLSVLPSFLLLWLLPRIPELIRLGDSFGRSLVVSASKALVDLEAGDDDAAIRLGHGQWPGLHAEKLLDETLVPVCSPEMARRVGTIEPGQVPSGVTLLGSRLDPWERWAERGSSAGKRLGVLTIDDAAAVVMSAEQGLGVALARGCLVADALREGRLAQVGDALAYRFSYYWVSSQRMRSDAFANTVADALRAAATPQKARSPPG